MVSDCNIISIVKYKRLLILIFVIAILLRIMFLWVGIKYLPIGSDEAILGLMAKHICGGEFPLMTWVQPHGGTLEAYLNAPLYLLFKTGKLTVRLLPFIFSLLFLVMGYLIGREYFGQETGIVTASLMAIPPVYLSIMGALGVSMNFPALLGSAVIVYTAHRIIFANLTAGRKLLLLVIMGVVGGLTFWVHLIVICALLSALLFFFINDRLFFTRRDFPVLVLSFIAGSSPLWIYNFSNNFETFRMIHSVSMMETLSKLKMCFTFTLPAAWGLYLPTYIDSSHFLKMPQAFSFCYALICIMLVVTAIIIAFRRSVSSAGMHHRSGTWILLFFLLVNIAVFARNSRSTSSATRYLAPAFIVLIPLIAAGLCEIRRRSGVLFAVLLVSLISFNLAGNVIVMKAWAGADFPAKYLSLPENDKLISFLEDEDIRYGYMHYWLSYPVVFKTDERIKLSPAYDERFGQYVHPYIRDVQSAENIAYIFHSDVGLKAGWFRDDIRRIRAEYRKKDIGEFTVFHDFKPPAGAVDTVDKQGFSLHSNYGIENLHFAIDGDHTTRWGTGSPQKPRMYFTVDMGKTREICGAVLYLDGFQHDFPRGLRVHVSNDSERWRLVYNNSAVGGSLYWEKEGPRIYTDEKYIRIIFKPISARWVKFIQTGSDSRMDWSIAEFDILQEK